MSEPAIQPTAELPQGTLVFVDQVNRFGRVASVAGRDQHGPVYLVDMLGEFHIHACAGVIWACSALAGRAPCQLSPAMGRA